MEFYVQIPGGATLIKKNDRSRMYIFLIFFITSQALFIVSLCFPFAVDKNTDIRIILPLSLAVLVLNMGAVYFGIHSLKDKVCNRALKHPKRWHNHNRSSYNASLTSSRGLGLSRCHSNLSNISRGSKGSKRNSVAFGEK
jgi:hypothetical protein